MGALGILPKAEGTERHQHNALSQDIILSAGWRAEREVRAV